MGEWKDWCEMHERNANPQSPTPVAVDDAELARLFHETYERLAPNFNYQTRKASAVPWDDVPPNNKALMTAVCRHVREALHRPLADEGLGEMVERLRKQDERGKEALDYYYASTCPCDAAERYVPTCPKHGTPAALNLKPGGLGDG